MMLRVSGELHLTIDRLLLNGARQKSLAQPA
jgi:hypothetical protein